MVKNGCELTVRPGAPALNRKYYNLNIISLCLQCKLLKEYNLLRYFGGIMLKALNLSYKYNYRKIFSDISFTLYEGELMLLCGENGSGKTTLIRVLSGLESPDAGMTYWLGNKLLSSDDYNGSAAYLGHKNSLYIELSVLDNLELSALIMSEDLSGSKIKFCLEMFRLNELSSALVKELSAGQQRRLAFACLYIKGVKLWFLDEPFVCLDTVNQKLIENMIENHIADGGIVVMTCHRKLDLSVPNIKYLELGGRVLNV